MGCYLKIIIACLATGIIENAYSQPKEKAQQKLNLAKTNLDACSGNIKADGYEQANKELKKAEKSFNKINDLFTQVDNAISDLKKYNPDLYNKLVNLKDLKGNRIIIYVKISSSLVGSDGQSLYSKSTMK
jgi:hypothetical protein